MPGPVQSSGRQTSRRSPPHPLPRAGKNGRRSPPVGAAPTARAPFPPDRSSGLRLRAKLGQQCCPMPNMANSRRQNKGGDIVWPQRVAVRRTDTAPSRSRVQCQHGRASRDPSLAFLHTSPLQVDHGMRASATGNCSEAAKSAPSGRIFFSRGKIKARRVDSHFTLLAQPLDCHISSFQFSTLREPHANRHR